MGFINRVKRMWMNMGLHRTLNIDPIVSKPEAVKIFEEPVMIDAIVTIRRIDTKRVKSLAYRKEQTQQRKWRG